MVATINSLVTKSGDPIIDDTGCQLYGGHSLRTGGAHLLSSRGIHPFKIQATIAGLSEHFGRHGAHLRRSELAGDLA